jgi:putative salt-induced outer membrane protein YdiY
VNRALYIILILILAVVTCVTPLRAQPTSQQSSAAVGFVLVTNTVIVTNYVVTTNFLSGAQSVALTFTNAAPGPQNDGYDWIQLNTGEWLKGRIKAMQERRLEFDSEKLELLTFDWKDIHQVQSPRFNEMLFEHHGKVSGPVTITPQAVVVGGAETRIFAREELQSITPGGSRERNHWSGKLSAGLTLHSGNTRSVDYNAQARLQRRTPATRFSLDYLGNISSVEGEESANNQRVNTEFDYWLSRRFYLILPQAEYFRDRFQNIAHRATIGGGVGYALIDRPGLEWNISTGPAYQKTWFYSVVEDEPTSRQALALTFGSKFDWEVTQRIDLILEYRGQYTSRQAGETFHHGVSKLEIELTKRFDLDVSFVWDRIQNPTQESSGETPRQDDFRLIVGTGVRF